jgi:hypothetical protein
MKIHFERAALSCISMRVPLSLTGLARSGMGGGRMSSLLTSGLPWLLALRIVSENEIEESLASMIGAAIAAVRRRHQSKKLRPRQRPCWRLVHG